MTANDSGGDLRLAEVKAWFVREVPPLVSVLIQFLSRGGHPKADVEDLRQDVYMRVCAAAKTEFPQHTRAMVFTVVRNLLVDRVRHDHVVSIEAIFLPGAPLSESVGRPGRPFSGLCADHPQTKALAASMSPPRG